MSDPYMSTEQILAILRETPRRIASVSAGLAPRRLHAAPAPGEWAANESYSRSAAAELGKYGITVNIVAPGPVQTGWLQPGTEKEIASRTPLRRIGAPADIADVVVFLASRQARWVTGQLLYVGGGWRMHQ